MDKIGTVKSILNDELILIESSSSLSEGDRLVVFVELSSDNLEKETGLKKIDIPKGEVIINSSQGNNIYLAATAVFEPRKRVSIESPLGATFGASLAASIAGMGMKRIETVESIPKTNPVPVDQKLSLNIKYKKEVTVGDAVAKKRGV